MRFHALLVLCAAGCAVGIDPAPMAPPPPVGPSPAGEAADVSLLAHRLARLLWNGPPDESVRTALRAGPRNGEHVRVVAEQMLGDPRARAGVRAFFRWWLLLDLLEGPADAMAPADAAPPAVDAALMRSMAGEAPALGAHLVLDRNGTWADLLTGPDTFMDERLAAHYGVPGVQGPAHRLVPYPPGQQRFGLYTGAGILSLFTSRPGPTWPAKRSWMVLESALCVALPRSFLLNLSPPDPARSIRAQMIDITADKGCMMCHKILNSPGFAFIGFDDRGRWRPEAGHGPGETAGWIPRDVLADEPRFEGPVELARLLAARPEAQRCFVRQLLQYARDPANQIEAESPALTPSLDQAQRAFEQDGLRLRSALTAVTATEAFLR
jgi:hypothetical protein